MYRVISPTFKGFSRLLASCRIAGLLLLAANAANAQESSAKTHIISSVPKPVQPLIFHDELGMQHRIQPSEAKLFIVHFWATWCVPCVRELGELDTVMGDYEPKGIKVVTISLDGDNIGKVKQFFKTNKIKHLTPFLDTNMMSFQMTQSPGLPTTIFINAKGIEVARAEGPLDWKGKEVTDFLKKYAK